MIIIDPKAIGYEHTVEAVNIDQDLLMIEMQGMPGLAHIDKYVDNNGNPVPKSLANYDLVNGVWAVYKIGDREFQVPLGGNLGEELGSTPVL